MTPNCGIKLSIITHGPPQVISHQLALISPLFPLPSIMNSPQESDAEGEIDPEYAHTGWGAAIDPLLAAGQSHHQQPAPVPHYGYYPPAQEYYPYPAPEEPAFEAMNNPYLEEEAVHNPYLDSPPPATYVEPIPEPVVHQPLTNGHAATTRTQQETEPDPLLLVPTAAPAKPPPRPAKAERVRPQPRARSSATPLAPGTAARRKPASPSAGPSTAAAPAKQKESKKPVVAPATPSATAPGPGPARGAVVRDELCSFCRGTDAKNKAGYMERMLSCERCGRSGESARGAGTYVVG